MLKASLLLICCIAVVANAIDTNQVFKDMDISDKCGQMTQISLSLLGTTPEDEQNPYNITKLREAVKNYRVGSLLGLSHEFAIGATMWQRIIKEVQDIAKETPRKIPVIYGIDSIHGANFIQEAVLFPQPISIASTFNTAIAEEIGRVTAQETKAVGIPWNFNPVLDVGRQPLWPRLWETFGEDVCVGSKMGHHYIRGLQGDNMKDSKRVAACLKHYIGYSYPLNGRDRSVAWIPENILREVFLPTFESGVLAGAPTVMINSGDVNGIPGHANYHYITEILKGELNFTGFTVSDWEDIIRLYTRDKVAESPREAVRIAVMAGLDMSMVPLEYSFYDHCISLAQSDTRFAARVDDAVKRILKVKNDMGLFENPYPDAANLANIGTAESENINLEAARESIILAKNDKKILPLDKNKKILVTGPSGNLVKVLNGGWSYSWQGDREDIYAKFGRKKYNVFQALQNRSAVNIDYSAGVDFDKELDIPTAVSKAYGSDVVILCIGEWTYTETPGNIDDLTISAPQMKLAQALFDTGKPVVVVYLGGRPRVMTTIAEKAAAVVIGFLPGNRGGEAIADVLLGNVNPSGKMPVSYPRTPNGFTTYDFKPLETFSYGLEYNPLYPFGHGLSYTTFKYSDLRIEKQNISSPESIRGSVMVRNTGNVEGKEAVLVYIQDEVGQVSRPNKQLKFFTKVNLKSGESATVNFEINNRDMSFIGLNNKRIVESGSFKIYVADLEAKFYLTVPVVPDTPTTTKSNSGLRNGFNVLCAAILLFISLFNFY